MTMEKSSASYQHGNLRRVSASSITMTDELKAELAKGNRPDDKVEFSDMPEMTSFENGMYGQFFRKLLP